MFQKSIDRAHQIQLDIRQQAAIEPDRLVRQHLEEAAFLLQGVQDHLTIADAGAQAHRRALEQQIAAGLNTLLDALVRS